VIQVLHALAVALGCYAAALFGVALVLLARLGRPVHREWHHAYLGMMLLAAPASWGWCAVLLWALGLWLVWDDAVQHARQIGERAYESPLHRWYVAAYRWAVGILARHYWRLPTALMLWLERNGAVEQAHAHMAEAGLLAEDAERVRAAQSGFIRRVTAPFSLLFLALLAAPALSAQPSTRPFVVPAAIADSAAERIRAQWPDSLDGGLAVAPDLCVVSESRRSVGRTWDGRDSVHAAVLAVAEPTDPRCKRDSPRVLFRASCEPASEEKLAEHVLQYVIMRRDYWLVACKERAAAPARLTD
jgi:hypothetical protein